MVGEELEFHFVLIFRGMNDHPVKETDRVNARIESPDWVNVRLDSVDSPVRLKEDRLRQPESDFALIHTSFEESFDLSIYAFE